MGKSKYQCSQSIWKQFLEQPSESTSCEWEYIHLPKVFDKFVSGPSIWIDKYSSTNILGDILYVTSSRVIS
jgi:hypothetical protein